MPRIAHLLVALVLVTVALGFPAPAAVDADAGLTAEVAAAYFPRYDDAELHAIAHERVAEIAACGCLDHEGMRSGTAEVLAYNEGFPDPVARVVVNWASSPGHHGILSDPSYGRIGCAERDVDGRHWFACVLAAGPLPPAPAPVVLLPNTGLPAP